MISSVTRRNDATISPNLAAVRATLLVFSTKVPAVSLAKSCSDQPYRSMDFVPRVGWSSTNATRQVTERACWRARVLGSADCAVVRVRSQPQSHYRPTG